MTLATEPAIVVPSAAVQVGQDGRYVFVVKSDGTAESRPVAVARDVGGETAIAQGLAAGETVVTEGQLRLFPGARVEARPATAGATPAGAPATSEARERPADTPAASPREAPVSGQRPAPRSSP